MLHLSVLNSMHALAAVLALAALLAATMLTIFRRDELRTVPLTLGGKPDGKWVLKRTPRPTPEQKAAYEDWLGRPWPAARSDDENEDKGKD